MSTVLPEVTSAPPPPTRGSAYERLRGRAWLIVFGGIVGVAAVRVITNADDITSANTLRAAILSACPILLAGMGGLWSERAGVVNIGLEGQMLMGTWGAAYFTYWYGPWAGLAGAAAFGALGGLLHGLATITFGVKSDMRNLRTYHRTPSIAPGNVSERTIRTRMTAINAGRINLLARSIPDRNPLLTTTAHVTITTPVHTS